MGEGQEMNLAAAIEINAGGPGSGCHGPNCGRPSVDNFAETKHRDTPKGWTDIGAQLGGKEVGFIRLAPGENNSWSVRMVAVGHENRRQGIATQLYQEAVNWVRKQGGKELTSDPGAGTEPEVAPIWRRMGAIENPNYRTKSDTWFRLPIK